MIIDFEKSKSDNNLKEMLDTTVKNARHIHYIEDKISLIKNYEIRDLYGKVLILEYQVDLDRLYSEYITVPIFKRYLKDNPYYFYNDFQIVEQMECLLRQTDSDLQILPHSFLNENGFNYLKTIYEELDKLSRLSQTIISVEKFEIKRNVRKLKKFLKSTDLKISRRADYFMDVTENVSMKYEEDISDYNDLKDIFDDVFNNNWDYEKYKRLVYTFNSKNKKYVFDNVEQVKPNLEKNNNELIEEGQMKRAKELVLMITELELIKMKRKLYDWEEFQYARLLALVEPNLQDLYVKLQNELLEEISQSGKTPDLIAQKKALKNVIYPKSLLKTYN